MNNILFDYTYEAPPTEEERNFGWRPEGQEVRAIVLHATESNGPRSYRILTHPRGTSANAMVNEEGEAYELVSTDVQCVKKCKNDVIVHCDTKMEEEATCSTTYLEKMAWHAGISEWKGESSVNHFSIGIEIINPGSKTQCDVFSKIQMDKVSELITYYQVKYPDITQCTIIGHSDIAPGRKTDPNSPLLWKYLAEEKQQGLWSDISPQSNATCLYGPTSKGEKVEDLQERLGVLGYKITANGLYDEQTHHVVSAFHRHFDDVQDEEMWDQLSDDRLNDVLQKAEDYGCL